jgi:hypothetical protein
VQDEQSDRFSLQKGDLFEDSKSNSICEAWSIRKGYKLMLWIVLSGKSLEQPSEMKIAVLSVIKLGQ